jgi:hypothetical protein
MRGIYCEQSRFVDSMLYTMLYMAATRTQIYLTAEQRDRLDERGAQTGLGLAEMIRQAVDAYLGAAGDIHAALDDTYGSLPNLDVQQRG